MINKNGKKVKPQTSLEPHFFKSHQIKEEEEEIEIPSKKHGISFFIGECQMKNGSIQNFQPSRFSTTPTLAYSSKIIQGNVHFNLSSN